MPEGIEIRKFVSMISTFVVGHDIVEINILQGRYKKKIFDGYKTLHDHLPLNIKSCNCKGKAIYLELYNVTNDKTIWLFNTLGLTGGWIISNIKTKDLQQYTTLTHNGNIYIYPNVLEGSTNAIKHLNIEFILDNAARLYFYDQLSFGTLTVFNTQTQLDAKLKLIGPDIMDDTTTFEIFKQRLCKKTNLDKPIGNVIVNQKLISGIGNYLRADALWLSKISPFRKLRDITTDAELLLLYKNIRMLMWSEYDHKKGLEKQIISSDYKSPSHYGRTFFIYQESTDIHGNKVEKKELYEGSQKRFVYFVPTIQI